MAQIGLGIYKAEKIISIACVRRAIRQVSVKDCFSFSLNDTDCVDDSLLNRLTGRIRDFCETNKIKPSFVNFGLPREDFISNIIEMPPVARADIRQILNYELESHVPLDPESYYFDALPIPLSERLEQSKVLLTCAPRSRVDELLEISSRSDLRLDQVEPSVMARIINASIISRRVNPRRLRSILILPFPQAPGHIWSPCSPVGRGPGILHPANPHQQ